MLTWTAGHDYADGRCRICEKTQDRGSCGANVTWQLDETGLLTISGTGPMENYGWPEGADWPNTPFYPLRQQITEVMIQNGVTNIGDYAFYHCRNLGGVTIPKSVTIIGSHSFDSCTSLKRISVPNNGIKTIEDYAF